jgi:hypothetical protein
MLGVLAEAKGRDDGFFDRLLLIFPNSLPKAGWSDDGISKQTAEAWTEMVKVLWSRPLNFVEGKECPHVVSFAPSAKDAWCVWYNSHCAEQNAVDFPDWLRGPWAKLEQYAARIILTLHMLHWAADPSRSNAGLPEVKPQIVRDAIRLVDYLKSHLRRVHALMRVKSKGNDGGEVVSVILKWIRRKRLESFSERDLTRNFPKLSNQPLDLQRALTWLEARKCLRHRPELAKPEGRRGRAPSPVLDVNPRLIPLLEGRDTTIPPAARESSSGSDDSGDPATDAGTQGRKENGDADFDF